MKEEQKLFEMFPPVSTGDWLEKIKTDLKGADFTKKMVWKTNEGFEVLPFYRSEDIKCFNHTTSLPGVFPFVRGNKTRNNNWFVRQNINADDYSEANSKALNVLMRGVDSLGFIIDNPDTISEENIEKLLDGIYPESIELNFNTAGKARELVQILVSIAGKRGLDISALRGSVEADPLGRLMVNGKLCVSIEAGLDYLTELVKDAIPMTGMRVVQVNGSNFSNAGADIVKELGFSLSMGNEYLSQLTEGGVDIDIAATSMGFTFGIGSNYFMEIAKLRAARLLWATIVNGYKPADEKSCLMNILSVTSEWNKTIYDPYSNLLRTQTEAMSATLGGTDSLVVTPFDDLFAVPGEFSERIARNQQLLLKEEAHISKVADPGAGSWYIENLTALIAEAAWKLFLEVEEKGGFLKALQEGFIQSEIEVIAEKRRINVARRKEVLLGANQYPNLTEKISDKADLSRAFRTEQPDEQPDVKPLKIFRGAEEFEKLRLASDRNLVRPEVFILAVGNPAMRLARAQFTSNFFGCAGYRVTDKGGFKTLDDGVDAALAGNAGIIVLCSSDEEYATMAPEAFAKINGKRIFVVAGAPECIDDLRKAGIEHFISMRSNVHDTLNHFHSLLGIEI